MNNPTRPPTEALEGTPPRGPSHTTNDHNKAALERLWARQLARAEAAREETRKRARQHSAARSKRYRKVHAQCPTAATASRAGDEA